LTEALFVARIALEQAFRARFDHELNAFGLWKGRQGGGGAFEAFRALARGSGALSAAPGGEAGSLKDGGARDRA
jgi:hypothetical protein